MHEGWRAGDVPLVHQRMFGPRCNDCLAHDTVLIEHLLGGVRRAITNYHELRPYVRSQLGKPRICWHRVETRSARWTGEDEDGRSTRIVSERACRTVKEWC